MFTIYTSFIGVSLDSIALKQDDDSSEDVVHDCVLRVMGMLFMSACFFWMVRLLSEEVR